MKKIFAVLALVGVMTSCKSKKKDEAKPETTTTTDATTTPTDATTTPTTTEPSNTAVAGVPSFKDADVQKFANDYTAFINEYKAGMADPAKAAQLATQLQEWSKKSTEIGMKLAKDPEEAKKWSDWAMELSKMLTPGTK